MADGPFVTFGTIDESRPLETPQVCSLIWRSNPDPRAKKVQFPLCYHKRGMSRFKHLIVETVLNDDVVIQISDFLYLHLGGYEVVGLVGIEIIMKIQYLPLNTLFCRKYD